MLKNDKTGFDADQVRLQVFLVSSNGAEGGYGWIQLVDRIKENFKILWM